MWFHITAGRLYPQLHLYNSIKQQWGCTGVTGSTTALTIWNTTGQKKSMPPISTAPAEQAGTTTAPQKWARCLGFSLQHFSSDLGTWLGTISGHRRFWFYDNTDEKKKKKIWAYSWMVYGKSYKFPYLFLFAHLWVFFLHTHSLTNEEHVKQMLAYKIRDTLTKMSLLRCVMYKTIEHRI